MSDGRLAAPAATGLAPFTILVAVGPSDRDVLRLHDLRSSLHALAEAQAARVILIDDAPQERGLTEVWPEARVVRSPERGRQTLDPYSAMVAGTLAGLAAADGAFALKLDTDALFIGPFAQSIERAFRQDRALGVVGACERSPGGQLRDFSMWPSLIRRAAWPIYHDRRCSRGQFGLRLRRREDRRAVRGVIRAACANPTYELGAHCLGGAYAVSPALVKRLRGCSAQHWLGSGLGEDVVVGLLCAASGLRMRSMVGSGEPFGIGWRCLPFEPEELLSRRYGITHPVADGPHGTEQQLRAFFASRR